MENQGRQKLKAKFWLWHLVVPVAVFLLAAVLCELTDVDLLLADRFFDFFKGEWPARESWWAQWLIHKRGRDLIAVIAGGSLFVWIASFLWTRFRAIRWQVLYLFLSICLATGAVTAGKKLTGRHCPWDMERYGGQVPYTRLFEATPAACAPGNCFPAGHASGGFSLFAGYFAWRDRRPRVARRWLFSGLLLGSIYGYGQMARGAHFFSHNIWTAIICWLIPLGLYLLMRRQLLPTNDVSAQAPHGG